MTNEDDKYRFQCRVEIGHRDGYFDIYVTYNDMQWSGFTCRSLIDLKKVHTKIGEFLEKHEVPDHDGQ